MKSILYIEDNASVQLMVKRQLAKLGEVATASNLAEGRRLLRERAFNLLLSDVFLPDGESLELVFELRRNFTPQQFPVILVSASMDQLLRVKAFKLAVNDCFAMPTPWPVLLGAVKRMLEEPYVGTAGVQGAAVTWIEGAIEDEFWLFCPELNLFHRGRDVEKLRENISERVRIEVAKGSSLPLVRGVKVSERLVKLVAPLS